MRERAGAPACLPRAVLSERAFKVAMLAHGAPATAASQPRQIIFRFHHRCERRGVEPSIG